ncbi:hypothetical protein ACFQ7F_28420 [Streptomyces sp. NPDC056486]|uniref:hypothetical protein n=1 Tax=Streptomyces sp. NPDC056486 TaxID=3345835 RepID=UPI00368DA9DD
MRAARPDQTARSARLSAVRPVLWAAFAALATGAVLCVIGWYGMSGERFAERQLPYLASCTVPGAALIIAGAVLFAHGRSALATARVEELYELLVTAGTPPATTKGREAPVATSGDVLMIPGGTLWHRADCPLVAGKPEAVPADAHILATGDLSPCPICDPQPSPTSSSTPAPER